MTIFGETLAAGLVNGSLYGLVGLCFVLIYKVTKVINFAQGAFVVVGGALGIWCLVTLHLPFVAAALIALLGGAALALMLAGVVIVPMSMRGAPIYALVIGTLGFELIVTTVTQAVFGPYEMTLTPIFGTVPVILGGVYVSTQQLFVVGLTLACAGALWLFLTFTPSGLAVQAVGTNPEAASALGINTRTIAVLVIGLSGAISGIAGLAIAPITGIQSNMGIALLVDGFVAGVIGGFGQPFGALAGGAIVGVSTAMVAAYWGSEPAAVSVFVVMLLVLLVRPRGLFPEHDA